MNFQEYIQSLNVDDEIIITDRLIVVPGVVSKITPTGIIKIIPHFNKFMEYSFDKNGLSRGNNYHCRIVNKHNQEEMAKVNYLQAKTKMHHELCKTISFLDKQKNVYSPKNAEILTNIQQLLKEWERDKNDH